MKQFMLIALITIITFFSPTSSRVLVVISIEDSAQYSTANSLEITEKTINFTIYSPVTVPSLEDEKNGAWIEWEILNGKFTNFYPTYTDLFGFENYSLSQSYNGPYIKYSIERGFPIRGITSYVYFDKSVWTKDYWDITDALFTNESQPSEEVYQESFRSFGTEGYAFIRDLVYLQSSDVLVTSMYTFYIDHDILLVNYTALGQEAYLRPIFRSYPGFPPTFSTIYVGEREYDNGSLIPLRGVPVPPEQNVITGDPLPQEYIQRLPSSTTIPYETGLMTVSVVSSLAFTSLEKKKRHGLRKPV